MVELDYRTRNLFGGLAYAKSLGLATGIYTIPVSLGEMFIANMRDDVDEMTVDYPMAKARQVVSDNNGLVYFNTPNSRRPRPRSPGIRAPPHRRLVAAPELRANRVAGGIGDALFGTSLGFVSTQSRRARSTMPTTLQPLATSSRRP